MSPEPGRRRWTAFGAALAFVLFLATLFIRLGPSQSSTFEEGRADASFVGRATCAACHPAENGLWSDSHHDLAMREATPQTVLADFDGATLTVERATWTFVQVGERFLARVDGPEGASEYDVRYTFGVSPLQQYLVAFPGGRFQVLSIAWDSRPREQGGQRWFDLHDGLGIRPDHPLHWARPERSWNTACAECHSTNVEKGFDLETRSHSTTWFEIDVSCEACHGPGSEHVRLAEEVGQGGEAPEPENWWVQAAAPDPGRAWAFRPEAATAARAQPRTGDAEVQTCAHCHARRAQIDDGWRAGVKLLDADVPSLLREDLYHPDGQILDEVYVYGSFVQSRMYRAGVTCSDCHDPHSLGLRAEGNALCTRCHLASAYDDASHHFHAPGSQGAQCVACHMPAATYMQVDPRRDHSLRVPRPDVSATIGAPDACTSCHQERDSEWAARAAEGWYGPPSTARPHFGEIFARARHGDPRVAPELARIASDTLYPGIVRGSALSLLTAHAPGSADDAIRAGLNDPDPLVRLGAIEALRGRSEPTLLEAAYPLVEDSLRAVRIRAGRLLATLPSGFIGADRSMALQQALEEFDNARRVNGDHPESWVSLGDLHADRGDTGAAEAAYRTALGLDSTYAPAHVNLADLLRASGRVAEEEAVLSRAAETLPGNANVQHALGLMWVRRGDLARALPSLEHAAVSDPGTPRYSYVYGVALTSAGDMERGMRVLGDAVARQPFDRDLLLALATLSRDTGDGQAAVDYAQQLVELFPEDAEARSLLVQLRSSRN